MLLFMISFLNYDLKCYFSLVLNRIINYKIYIYLKKKLDFSKNISKNRGYSFRKPHF